MAVNNSFSRLLIVNGQPILIKNDSGLVDLSSIQSLSSDILQQAMDDATTDSIPAGIESVNSDRPSISMDREQNVSIESDTGENQYVTVLSSDNMSEEGSTIKITLEQAAELGLSFSVDNMDSLFELNSVNDKEDDEEKRQFSILTTEQTSEITKHHTIDEEIELPNTLSDEGNLSSTTVENTTFLDQFQSLDSSQRFSLVPQIINGAVTYTLQICNDSNTESNEYFNINTPSIGHESNFEENDPKNALSSNNTSSSPGMSFINSQVNLVSNNAECSVVSSGGSRSDIINDNLLSVPMVSSDTNNVPVTFLNLSEQIPISSMADIITHPEKSQDSKMFTINMTPSSVVDTAKLKSKQLGHQFTAEERAVSTNQRNDTNQRGSNMEMVDLFAHSTSKRINNKISGHTRPAILERSTKANLSSSILKLKTDSKKDEGSLLKKTSEENPSDFLIITGKNYKQSGHESLLLKKEFGKKAGQNDDANHSSPTIITPNGGDIPEEVSHVLSNIPVKSDRNKPLGSNENPIKLVQQGHTFHSTQALTEEHISKLKPILNEKFDSRVPSKNIVYDPVSKTRIIYRIISPEEVSLRKQEEFPRKRGRPKKVRSVEGPSEEMSEEAPAPKKMFPRTRSGRLSRPPKHMVRDYKHLRRAEIDDSDGAYSDYQSEHEDDPTATLESAPVDLLPGLAVKRKSQKRNISAGNLCPTCGKIYLGYMRMKMHFERYPDHGSIEYLNTVRNSNPDSEGENHKSDSGNGFWKKKTGKKRRRGRNGYLSLSDRSRLKEALIGCGDKDLSEIAGPAVASVLSLWELLLLRVDCIHQDSRVLTLYQELCQLLQKIRSVAHRLFRPITHIPASSHRVTIKIEDEIMTKVLDLPCGDYVASDEDLNDISTPPAKEVHSKENQVPPTSLLLDKKQPEEMEQNLKSKLEMNEVNQPFLLSGEEMICDTDERSLVNVDEIVSERLENFSGSQSSSVDELMKGLNELEQRNKLGADDLMDDFSIVSQTNHVSASTEDLMKSLEHFDSGLAHTDSTVSLDRDTFDRVANVDTLDFEVLSREFHSNNR